ncbi:hypothetical protein DTO96_102190 [Ephemeroptericola cinctiostellae]|uniref:Mu-like prophage FluMu protein gp29 n=1 Tax=Ephemeroptericola cinctiostellae TaxID=2268024 RepID=A0A345DDJ8_9BURK|nr:DUF935 family protein [Ephemeroptericola cinctiostellae]AXF86436.1 hypothetical protein DTO96_102190 [Ephemeroptericola cinctiostellae]
MADNKFTKPTKEMLGQEIASTGNDWSFFNKLSALPNPDPILRRIGKSAEVYNSIMADGHVTGDVRSIRGSFRSHSYRVLAGDESDSRAQDARELCEYWLEHIKPNSVAQDWLEVMWQQCSAIFTGYKVHEVVWNYREGKLLPVLVKDRANNRFRFDVNGDLLLIKPDNPQGVAVEPWQFVVSRHMATCDNPYGEALLSRCFWPWTFKTGGFKYFMQYCEKFGVPVPFGQYPQGASPKEIDAFEDSLAGFINNSYILAPDGSKLELLTPTGSGSTLPQESLINLCNREMSKALTSQAMTAELQNVGARAASETAAERQLSVNDADRDIAAGSMSEIFKWITLFNFGDSVAPPVLEFYKDSAASKERAETYKIAADMGLRPSRRAMLEELNIPDAVDDNDAILPSVSTSAPNITDKNAVQTQFNQSLNDDLTFSQADSKTIAAAKAELDLENAVIDAVDAQFEADVIQPFADMLDEFAAAGKTLAEFQESLGAFLGGVDTENVRVLTEQALILSALNEMVDHTEQLAADEVLNAK